MKATRHLPAQNPLTKPSPANVNQNGTELAACPDEVARKAYFAYVNEGCPEGRHVQHWLAAEASLIKERDLTRAQGALGSQVDTEPDGWNQHTCLTPREGKS